VRREPHRNTTTWKGRKNAVLLTKPGKKRAHPDGRGKKVSPRGIKSKQQLSMNIATSISLGSIVLKTKKRSHQDLADQEKKKRLEKAFHLRK